MCCEVSGNLTVQLWTDSQDCSDTTIKELAEAGYKLIFSNIDGAYLDCGYAGWVTDGNNWCSPYRGWQVRSSHLLNMTISDCRPCMRTIPTAS